MKIILNNGRSASRRSSAAILVGVLIVAAALRAPITIIGPLLDLIRTQFGLGAAQAGLLTALPLLAFAVTSPFIGRLAEKYGLERTLFAGMLVLASGILLRSSGSEWALFAGTWFVGAGIAVGNVLLPSLLKRDFASQVASITATYTLVMALASAFTSSIAIPISQHGRNGWHVAFGSVVLLPALAMLAWLPQLSTRSRPPSQTPAFLHRGRTWRSPLAWQLSIFMGLTSCLYYVTVSWLSSVLVEAGYSQQRAGSLQGALHLGSALTALVMVTFGQRLKDQRRAAMGASLLTAAGFVGLALNPAYAVAWIGLLGVGIGAAMILGLSFLSLRSSSAQQVAALSGMAQCVGYLLGAAGPPILGALHEAHGSWFIPLMECGGLGVVMACAGWLSGRDRQIDSTASPSVQTTPSALINSATR